MKAIYSGQAGLAVALTEPPLFRPVGQAPYPGEEALIWPAFGGFTDVEEIEVDDADLAPLDQLVAKAWALDRAIYRLFLLFSVADMGEDLEAELAKEFAALVARHDIEDVAGEWLDGVELGPEHEDRSLVLARRHRELQPAMKQLFPAISGILEAEAEKKRQTERAARDARRLDRVKRSISVRRKTGGPYGGRSYSSGLSDNDRKAADLVRRIVLAAARRLASSTRTKGVNRKPLQEAMLDAASRQAEQEVIAAIEAAELSGLVKAPTLPVVRKAIARRVGIKGSLGGRSSAKRSLSDV